MNEQDGKQLPPVSKGWIGLYCFAAIWLLTVASLDASHFGPGFFPLLISLVLVPLLAFVFFSDLILRIADAVEGKGSSLARRLVPVLVAAIGTAVYGGICILFVMQRG